MKFVFNDSITASITTENIDNNNINIVTSGMILEKRMVTAGTYNTVDDILKALAKAANEADKKSIMNHPEVKTILSDPEKMFEFTKKISTPSSGSSSSSSGNDPASMITDYLTGGAERVGEGAEAYAPFLSQKDQIIARLKPHMSDKDIGEVFYRFLDELKLPFTETIGILEFCIQQSRSCYAKVKDLINFYLAHYGQKLQGANTKRIIELACEYQKLNPTVDIFSVLGDAVAGKQPKVNLGYLSKDPDSQLVFNNLIMLSQASLPDQDEEIRRRFQKSRDALRNAQEKVNMQRAIYDMMKTEEMNLQLEKMLINFIGPGFKLLLSNPLYRALKDMFYDLKAGGILLNQLNSIFGAESNPTNPRITYPEQQIERENVFPTQNEGRQPFSNEQYRFLKLASPDITRHIYAQTAPAAATAPAANKPTPQELQLAGNFVKQILDSIGKTATDTLNSITNVLNKLKLKGIITKITNFFNSLINGIKKIYQLITQGKLTTQDLENVFSNIIVSLSGQSKTAYNQDISLKNGNSNQNSFSLVKKSQKSPQQGITRPGGDELTAKITQAVNIIVSVGTVIATFILAPRAAAVLAESDWDSLIKLIGPVVIGLKNTLIQVFLELNIVGGNAPQSSMFFDNNGNLTDQGKLILSNNRETMIALGISDADASAFGRFAVQRTYFMEQLRIKEDNLQAAESQAVQTGNPRQPETTVGDLPVDFQAKLKDFLNFCTQIENQFKANVNLLRNALKNTKNLDQAQQAQASGLLSALEKDLIEIQAKKAEWSSMKNIAEHMMRKRQLLQKLKPLQTQLNTLKKLGIPMANIIASPNGILAQVSKIRSEEQQALDKLRKEYYEKMDLLKNPDKISPMMKLPTNTGLTKLPTSPNQVNTGSPFDKSDKLDSEKSGDANV
jgi:hypothetical protein